MTLAGKVLLTIFMVGILLGIVGDAIENDMIFIFGTILVALLICTVVVGGLICLWFL